MDQLSFTFFFLEKKAEPICLYLYENILLKNSGLFDSDFLFQTKFSKQFLKTILIKIVTDKGCEFFFS